MMQSDFGDGMYILVEGRQVERFAITFVVDGRRIPYPDRPDMPGTFELRQALDYARYLQNTLGLPPERVLVNARSTLANVLPLDRQRLKRALKEEKLRER